MSDQVMAQWQIEREAREAEERKGYARFRVYARDIAAALGDEFTLEPARDESRSPHIIHTGGYGFYLTLDGWKNKGRVSVGPIWPRGVDGREAYPHFSKYSGNGETAPGITFVKTKTATQAAREIARRFLPAYLPIWQREATRQAEIIDARVSRRALAGDVAEIVGGAVKDDRDGNAVVHLFREYRQPGIESLTLHDDGEIKITVCADLAMLRAIQNAITGGK